MTNQEFEEVLEHRLAKTRMVLTKKGQEYGKTSNRLSNFYDAATFNMILPEQALWGFVTKHIVALRDFIQFPGSATDEQFDEKIGDIICYMILLEALLAERKESELPNVNDTTMGVQ